MVYNYIAIYKCVFAVAFDMFISTMKIKRIFLYNIIKKGI